MQVSCTVTGLDITSVATTIGNCGPLPAVVTYTDSGSSSCQSTTRVTVRTWTATDACGNTATASQTITGTGCSCGCSYTNGGWGAPPKGKNIAATLYANFSTVYPSGALIGSGSKTASFSKSSNIDAFLPAGGTASTLSTIYANPTSTSAGVFAGQVLALSLNVAFSQSAPSPVTPAGFGNLLYCKAGDLYSGRTISAILAQANVALGGGVASPKLSIPDFNTLVTSLNEALDNCGMNAASAFLFQLAACPQ